MKNAIQSNREAKREGRMKTDREYQLQACRNLEAEMTALGWPTEAAHFRLRIRMLEKNLDAVSGDLQAVLNERVSGAVRLNAGIALGRLSVIREKLSVPSDHKSGFPISPVAGSRRVPSGSGCASSRNRKSKTAHRK